MVLCMSINKYQFVVETLTKEIVGGDLVPLGRFPSERSLMLRFGVARETIRRAVKELEERGMIYRRRGVGAFVSCKGNSERLRIGTLFTGSRYSEIFPRIERSVARLALAAGFDVVRADASRLDYDAMGRMAVELARKIASKGVKGVIFQPVEFSNERESANAEILRIFADKGISVVLVDCDAKTAPERSILDLVSLDNFSAGRMLADHLLERRAERVAVVARKGCADSVLQRIAGVECVFGFERVDRVFVADCTSQPVLRSALSGLPGLDAIVCQNDVAAVSVAKVLTGMGLSIPSDVMLAGFDDVSIAGAMCPRLTTVRQPCEEIAASAFHRLEERMGRSALPPVTVLHRGELMVRGSSDIYRCR